MKRAWHIFVLVCGIVLLASAFIEGPILQEWAHACFDLILAAGALWAVGQ